MLSVQLAEFLLYLRNLLKLKGLTMACYLSVFVRNRDPATKTKLGQVPELCAL